MNNKIKQVLNNHQSAMVEVIKVFLEKFFDEKDHQLVELEGDAICLIHQEFKKRTILRQNLLIFADDGCNLNYSFSFETIIHALSHRNITKDILIKYSNFTRSYYRENSLLPNQFGERPMTLWQFLSCCDEEIELILEDYKR